MTSPLRDKLRLIPKVDLLLELQEVRELKAEHGRPETVAAVRTVLDHIRAELRARPDLPLPDRQNLLTRISDELKRRGACSLRPLINGTGIVLHTNLGRAPLAQAALDAVRDIAASYSNLEYDLADGHRGSRHSHVSALICELTGAEDALTVNNNAAAVMLALSSLASGRDVIVSRGEQVEIGGSFRIPEVMRQSGARLAEVGATNRTHLSDYRTAVTDTTGLLLKVHTSNFAMLGFTAEAGVSELAELGRSFGIPLMVDAGSGCLIDLSRHGIGSEPVIRQYLQAGADVVTFSGDKLLGGPQAGIIAGSRKLLEPMKRHPLLRAFRCDKMTLAALEATLRLYRDERTALREIPILRMLTADARELSLRATRLRRYLQRRTPESVTVSCISGESSAGGGAFPLLRLPTTLLAVRIGDASPDRIEQILRQTSPAVIGRIQRDRFLLDVRTIGDDSRDGLCEALRQAAAQVSKGRQQ